MRDDSYQRAINEVRALREQDKSGMSDSLAIEAGRLTEALARHITKLEAERNDARASVRNLTALASRLLKYIDDANRNGCTHIVVLEDDASQVEEAALAALEASE